MNDWKEPSVWVPFAVVGALTGLIGWGIYEAAHDDKGPVRVTATQLAPVTTTPVVMAPGAQAAPVVVVPQQQHESHFFENWAMWHMITGGGNNNTHTREVHHVYQAPAAAPVVNHYHQAPQAAAPQHHGFVSTPTSSPKTVAAPVRFTPMPASRPSAIRVSSPSRSSSSSSSSRSSGGRR